MSLIYRTLDGEDVDMVEVALERIRAHAVRPLCVMTSFGKDSEVIVDLVKRAGVEADFHFNVTTVDPPEVLRFGRQYHPDVEWHRPRMSMFHMIVHKKMPPTRMIRYCCRELKERGGHDRIVVTGVRWAESAKRRNRGMFERCEYDRSKWFLNPIIDWSDKQVWEYIRKRNLPYCSLYDEGFTRIGCVGCPMQGEEGMRRDFARWPRFYRAYMRAFGRMLAQMEEWNMPNRNEWQTPEDVMHWWLTGKQFDRATRQEHLWDQPSGCFDQEATA